MVKLCTVSFLNSMGVILFQLSARTQTAFSAPMQMFVKGESINRTLSCMNHYLAVDSGGYMSMNSMCIVNCSMAEIFTNVKYIEKS